MIWEVLMMDLAQFEEMLVGSGIDVSLFGRGEAKTLDKFFQEVSDPTEGAMLLQDENGLLRVVNLVNIHVMYNNRGQLLKLREVLQVFNDGRHRSRPDRQAAISEKCHSDETIMSSVQRAIEEELGVKITQHESVLELGRNIVTKKSQSYPGILSEYRIEYFLYIMREENFSPEGYVEVQKDKKTYFSWERA